LLQGRRDPDNQALWDRYVERYRGVIVRTGRRAGLSEHDAEDFAQQSLLASSTAYRDGRYERAKGGLRAWMFGIVRVWLQNALRARGRRGRPADTAELEALPGDDGFAELETVWQQEWHAAVLRQCLVEIGREVEPSTLAAFERFALHGEAADQVAAALGLSVNAVYGAKRRVLRRLRELLPAISEIW
jgi:RNA polymerase sigma-70 factor (ECF subfamily)